MNNNNQKPNIYEEPRKIEDIDDCYFYHTIDIPGYGTMEGNWDLRKGLNEYLGRVDFLGKRALDVGTANGILCFEMEKRGAEVVAFDLSRDAEWDMVPFAKWKEYKAISKERRSIVDRLNNAYWFCHERLDSKAKVVYGNVYSIPEEIGPVDVAVYGSILLHLRDPFLALQNGAGLTRETIIITEVHRGLTQNSSGPFMQFLPDAASVEPKDAWWDLRPEVIVRMIGVLGFENAEVIFHKQLYEGKENQLYTVVGRRTSGFLDSERPS
ncbi:MAG: hypothetical protein K9N10_02370 [Deltaproteobacteria bacterium]|nr:hypothetical protein [Deltaproteobacteria bacterium]